MSIEGQGHFFTIYFPGFVYFVLYLAKISGERLQDHWSSGCICEYKDTYQLRSNCEPDQRLCFRFLESTIQVGPDRTRSSGSTELMRVIGEARSIPFFLDRPIFMFTVVYGIVYTMRQCY